jgi:hypothetical protein
VLDVFWWDEAGQGPAQQFLDGWIALMEPLYNGHVYQNYPRLGDPDYAFKYWGDAQAALWQVKQKYDPNNVFTFAQAVVPPSNNRSTQESIAPFNRAIKTLNDAIEIEAKVVVRL